MSSPADTEALIKIQALQRRRAARDEAERRREEKLLHEKPTEVEKETPRPQKIESESAPTPDLGDDEAARRIQARVRGNIQRERTTALSRTTELHVLVEQESEDRNELLRVLHDELEEASRTALSGEENAYRHELDRHRASEAEAHTRQQHLKSAEREREAICCSFINEEEHLDRVLQESTESTQRQTIEGENETHRREALVLQIDRQLRELQSVEPSGRSAIVAAEDADRSSRHRWMLEEQETLGRRSSVSLESSEFATLQRAALQSLAERCVEAEFAEALNEHFLIMFDELVSREEMCRSAEVPPERTDRDALWREELELRTLASRKVLTKEHEMSFVEMQRDIVMDLEAGWRSDHTNFERRMRSSSIESNKAASLREAHRKAAYRKALHESMSTFRLALDPHCFPAATERFAVSAIAEALKVSVDSIDVKAIDAHAIELDYRAPSANALQLAHARGSILTASELRKAPLEDSAIYHLGDVVTSMGQWATSVCQTQVGTFKAKLTTQVQKSVLSPLEEQLSSARQSRAALEDLISSADSKDFFGSKELFHGIEAERERASALNNLARETQLNAERTRGKAASSQLETHHDELLARFNARRTERDSLQSRSATLDLALSGKTNEADGADVALSLDSSLQRSRESIACQRLQYETAGGIQFNRDEVLNLCDLVMATL